MVDTSYSEKNLTPKYNNLKDTDVFFSYYNIKNK